MSRRRNKANNRPPVAGRDVAAPVRHVRWAGKGYALTFSNKTYRIMEDVYADYYGHPEIGLYDILAEIAIPKHRALMAAAYAAILAGGGEAEWQEFDEKFTLDDIEGFAEVMQQAILQSLPEPAAEDQPKNAAAAPTEKA